MLKSETKEPEVKIQSLTIQCPGRPDLVIPIPFVKNSKSSLFTLKEGSQYRLKFIFTVSKNIVSGLKYANFVWKTGLRGRSILPLAFIPNEEFYCALSCYLSFPFSDQF